MKGSLILIPTPIDNDSQISDDARKLLLEHSKSGGKILIEEAKVGRRRWLHYGLPRENIDEFILYNEHTREDLNSKIIAELKLGKSYVLMSDCGLPAFCDPGQELVSLCHDEKITVTSTSFSNSIALAIALSGFNHQKFVFEGFLSNKNDQRVNELKRLKQEKNTLILMDTPYRLKKLLEELKELNLGRRIFLGLDLNQKTEELFRGDPETILNELKDFKREFILIIEGINGKRS